MAAEHWASRPEEPETLDQLMGSWAAEMATMSEGAVGYASLKRYEEYVAGFRGQSPDGAELEVPGQGNATSFADGRHVQSADKGEVKDSPGDQQALRAGVGRVLNLLGLHLS